MFESEILEADTTFKQKTKKKRERENEKFLQVFSSCPKPAHCQRSLNFQVRTKNSPAFFISKSTSMPDLEDPYWATRINHAGGSHLIRKASISETRNCIHTSVAMPIKANVLPATRRTHFQAEAIRSPKNTLGYIESGSSNYRTFCSTPGLTLASFHCVGCILVFSTGRSQGQKSGMRRQLASSAAYVHGSITMFVRILALSWVRSEQDSLWYGKPRTCVDRFICLGFHPRWF